MKTWSDDYPPLPADEAKARFDELRRVLADTPQPTPLAEPPTRRVPPVRHDA